LLTRKKSKSCPGADNDGTVIEMIPQIVTEAFLHATTKIYHDYFGSPFRQKLKKGLIGKKTHTSIHWCDVDVLGLDNEVSLFNKPSPIIGILDGIGHNPERIPQDSLGFPLDEFL
jgi:hypothetical protein